jgi:hypothetical protein
MNIRSLHEMNPWISVHVSFLVIVLLMNTVPSLSRSARKKKEMSCTYSLRIMKPQEMFGYNVCRWRRKFQRLLYDDVRETEREQQQRSKRSRYRKSHQSTCLAERCFTSSISAVQRDAAPWDHTASMLAFVASFNFSALCTCNPFGKKFCQLQ